jgi:hypothetical protein
MGLSQMRQDTGHYIRDDITFKTKMDPKKIKKILKRQTTKKRANRQTARRRGRSIAIRNKMQVAQDIYKTLIRSNGKPEGTYKLKRYDFGMFEYGDPIKPSSKPSAATPKGRQKSDSIRQKKRKDKEKSRRNARKKG